MNDKELIEDSQVEGQEKKKIDFKGLLMKKTKKQDPITSEAEFSKLYEVLTKDQFEDAEKFIFDSNFFYPVKRKADNQVLLIIKDENLRKDLSQLEDQLPLKTLLKFAPTRESLILLDSTLYFKLADNTSVMSKAYTDEDAKILFHDLFTDAGRKKASDIHISWEAEGIAVKFRLDGKLKRQPTRISLDLGQALKNILVNKAGESEYEENEIAGAITEIIDGVKQEYRVSIGPTHYGYIIVIRLESMIDDGTSLEKWGYAPKAIDMIRNLYSAHHGIVLVTGATGSGKSTMLYTCMIEKKRNAKGEEPEILTVEDPVEIPINGINQVQVNTKGDAKNHMTFTRAIKMFLRQDPDLIVVGEIRDNAVAIQAVTAAKTGHLTMSTLHTNDVKSTMTRLNELGIDNANLEDGLKGVISQRLLNSLCDSCKIKVERNGVEYYERNKEGCGACRNSPTKGYKGRVPAVEIAELNNRQENYKQENFDEYYSLEENVIYLLEQGIIDEVEARRYIRMDKNSDMAKRKELLAIWSRATKEKSSSNDIFPIFQNILDSRSYPLSQEAYLRVRNGDGNLMSPSQILDLTKNADLYQSLSMFILDRIIDSVRKTGIRTFVNIDEDNIFARDFKENILQKLEQSDMKEKIVLEFKFDQRFKSFMAFCNKHEIQVSLDSFDGNISDIVFMKRQKIKVDFIKTNRDLIEGLAHEEDWIYDYIDLLQKQGASIIINYIETMAIYKELVKRFEDKVQGFMGFGLHRPTELKEALND